MSTTATLNTPTSRGSPYAELSRRVRAAGLLDRRPWYYAARIAINLVLLAAGATTFFTLGQSWYQLIVAGYLAVVFTQMAFIGHDAGHKQIFTRRRPNAAVGLLHGNLLTGFSFGWWVDKHNRHHANPNTEDHDPDIGAGAIAFLDKHAEARHGMGRLIARWQAYLFFPLLMLEALNLHYASIRAVLAGKVRARTWERLLLAVHLLGYPTVLLLVLPPLQALAFFGVHQAVFGLYLGATFAPNHKGMPIIGDADDLDYLSTQVLTSRNVTGGRIIDIAMGGLNHQIEHHLFPNMPRPALRHAKTLIRGFCREHNLPYTEATVTGSYTQALRHLNAVGKTTTQPAATG